MRVFNCCNSLNLLMHICRYLLTFICNLHIYLHTLLHFIKSFFTFINAPQSDVFSLSVAYHLLISFKSAIMHACVN